MRLLRLEDSGDFSLVEFFGNNIPPYAILSHTWGADHEEVTFKDLVDGAGKSKAGYSKIRFCGKQAANDGLQFCWVDTCCIDKSSSAELSEAINSMFRWYHDAAKCYVYLSDVSIGGFVRNDPSFRKSKWFTRGWTLQELIAPTSVEFFSAEGERLGDKISLVQEIYAVTGISVQALQRSRVSQFSVDERMSWAEKRETKREEDAAYSLLGIFDIHMPLLYGEGRKKAFVRLQKEIRESLRDERPILSRIPAAEVAETEPVREGRCLESRMDDGQKDESYRPVLVTKSSTTLGRPWEDAMMAPPTRNPHGKKRVIHPTSDVEYDSTVPFARDKDFIGQGNAQCAESFTASVNPFQTALKLLNLSSSESNFEAVSKCMDKLDLVDTIASIIELQANLDNTSSEEEAKKHKEQKKLEEYVRTTYRDAVSRCLSSLKFPGMGIRDAGIEQPAENTCRWIYKERVYQQWAEEPNKLLWIKGKPGSGKSILMKSLLTERCQNVDAIHLNFFFNGRGGPAERTPIALYITLMRTLLRQLPLLMCEFLPEFLEKEMNAQGGKVIWQLQELSGTFHTIVGRKQPSCIEILVDALDECEEDSVRRIIENFENSITTARKSGARLRICWSSRYYPHISLQSERGLELQMDKCNNSDIRRYMKKEINAERNASILFLWNELISRTNGVFLWAVLVTRRLRKAADQGQDKSQLEKLLQSIPTELDDLFNKIFQDADISVEQRQEMIRIAQWILCAFRPLTIYELFTALYLQSCETPATLDVQLSDDIIERLKKRVNHVSGGLFEVVSPPPCQYRDNRELARVQVIHESVREFFLQSKGLKVLQFPSRETFVDISHTELAASCSKALLAKEFSITFPRVDLTSPAPIVNIQKFLVLPCTPAHGPFLEHYVQYFALKHFERACVPPLQTRQIRRQAVANLLRLHCSEILSSRHHLRHRFSAPLRNFLADPTRIGFESAELLSLTRFVDILSICSEFFAERAMHMHMPLHNRNVAWNVARNVARNEVETYVALFYQCREEVQPFLFPPFLGQHSVSDNDAIRSDSSSVRFMFGMTFNLGDVKYGMRNLQDNLYIRPHFGVPKHSEEIRNILTLYDWSITENFDELVGFLVFKRVLNRFPQARFQDYENCPHSICVVLRCPSKKEVAIQNDWGLTEGKRYFVGCGTSSLPTVDGEFELKSQEHEKPIQPMTTVGTQPWLSALKTSRKRVKMAK